MNSTKVSVGPLTSTNVPEPTVARTSSTEEDDSKSSEEVQEPEVEPEESKFKVAGTWNTFIGKDRTNLQKEPVIFNQGFKVFGQTFAHRMKCVFTRRLLLCIIFGQLLSVAITSTSVLTTELVMNNWSMPTFQSFFLYFFLNLIYTPYTIYRYGWKAYGRMLFTDGWKYIILAAVDVEANFLVVKAYGYTDLLSAMLLDAFAVPSCMIFAYFLVKARYHWTQILGVCISIAGLGLLVTSDFLTDKNYDATNRVLGDVLILIGAVGYGLSNSLEEYFVRKRPLYEVVGQLGFWGMIIGGIQAAALEHDLFMTVDWSGANIGYLIGYIVSLLFLYTIAPILFRLSSSPFYNLSILTSDFYGLCFGLGLFGYSPYYLYFIAYPMVLVGLIIYFLVARPESTAELLVVARGTQLEREEKTGKSNVVGK